MDAFERLLELDEHLLSFALSPQRNRPPLEPTDFREAIVFHHPREACERIGCAAVIRAHQSVAYFRPRHATCPRSHTRHGAVNELQSRPGQTVYAMPPFATHESPRAFAQLQVPSLQRAEAVVPDWSSGGVG